MSSKRKQTHIIAYWICFNDNKIRLKSDSAFNLKTKIMCGTNCLPKKYIYEKAFKDIQRTIVLIDACCFFSIVNRCFSIQEINQSFPFSHPMFYTLHCHTASHFCCSISSFWRGICRCFTFFIPLNQSSPRLTSHTRCLWHLLAFHP